MTRVCADCGRKSSPHTPVGRYHARLYRLLCMGCLAARRVRGERWERA